jgi:hypothetical protein
MGKRNNELNWAFIPGESTIFSTSTSYTMRPADLSLLIKKIVVGVVIAAIPLLIISSGLWLTRILLDHPHTSAASTPPHAHQ